MLICKNNIIVVPKILQNYVVNWYHTCLLHMVQDNAEVDIIQQYSCPNLRYNPQTHIEVCNNCHKNKKQNFKCGKLTAKEAEAIPWDKLSVDIIGSYKIRRKGRDNTLILKALTIIDP